MANPGLAMIPSGYKAGKLYSVLPQDGTGDFTVVRNSVATRVNENGVIEEVAANVPRLDYTDGGCPVLNLEPQATNSLTYSEGNLSTYQSKGGTAQDAATSIVGFDNSIEMTNNSVTSYAYKGNFTPTIGVNYVISVFVEMDDGSVPVFVDNTSSSDFRLVIEGTFASLNLNVERIGNTNVYRCSGGLIPTGTISSFGIVKYIANSPKGFKFSGIQLEVDNLTSYIKTEGTTVTRLKDEINNAGDVTTFNSEEGVLFVEMAALSDDLTDRYISIVGEPYSSNDRLHIYFNSISNQINSFARVNGVTKINATTTSYSVTDFNRCALVWSDGRYAFYVNGVEIGSNTNSGTFNTNKLSNLDLSLNSISNFFFGKIKQLRVYKTALTDQELQDLTTL